MDLYGIINDVVNNSNGVNNSNRMDLRLSSYATEDLYTLHKE